MPSRNRLWPHRQPAILAPLACALTAWRAAAAPPLRAEFSFLSSTHRASTDSIEKEVQTTERQAAMKLSIQDTCNFYGSLTRWNTSTTSYSPLTYLSSRLGSRQSVAPSTPAGDALGLRSNALSPSSSFLRLAAAVGRLDLLSVAAATCSRGRSGSDFPRLLGCCCGSEYRQIPVQWVTV